MADRVSPWDRKPAVAQSQQQQQSQVSRRVMFVPCPYPCAALGEDAGPGLSLTPHAPHSSQRHRFRTQEEYDAYLRVAHESVAIGQETLAAVAGQQGAWVLAGWGAARCMLHATGVLGAPCTLDVFKAPTRLDLVHTRTHTMI